MKRGDIIADRFEVEALAGSGAMGAVYRALDRTTGIRVALKFLQNVDRRYSGRLGREARTLASLQHPAIVGHVDHGVTATGDVYLAMQWLEGVDLGVRLGQGALSTGETLDLVRRVASALGAAHAAGVVHRDVKPPNVFLVGGDPAEAVLVDFGVVRLREGTVATAQGSMIGTPGYMSPEQARGEGDVDARADVFSLGCVLYRCLAGEPPFAGEHMMALLAKLVFEEPAPLSDRACVPRELVELVARMMSKDRALRPSDGAAVVVALDALPPPDVMLDEATRPFVSRSFSGPSALTDAEQRVVNVVVASNDEATPVAAREADARAWARLAAIVKPFGARPERLGDGSIIAVLVGAGEATDQAVRAARVAVAFREVLPERPIAVATGRGVVGDRLALGQAIDRAGALLREPSATRARPVRLDDTTAGLLSGRFLVAREGATHVLVSERDPNEAGVTLLGQAAPCVGRDRELAMLDALFAEVVDEPVARAVLVSAPAGLGKSRVRIEATRRFLERDPKAAIWIARGDTMTAGSPYGMLAELVRRAAGIATGDSPTARGRKLTAKVAERVRADEAARVTEFLAELVDAEVPESVERRSARADRQLMADQIARAWEDFVSAEARARPLVLVLEDLHWGDLPSVKLLDAMLESVRELPVLVFALARPDVHDLFPKLWNTRDLQEIRLAELTPKAAERLVRGALGSSADAATVTRVIERANGNAFFLEELVRAVSEGRGDALPETVLAIVEVRLEALDGPSRRLLRAASVFGLVFTPAAVTALLGDEGLVEGVRARLDALAARELVTRRRASASTSSATGEPESVAASAAVLSSAEQRETYAFRHALVREAAYAMLTDDDRALAHRLAAEYLERRGAGEAMALGEHFERAGEAPRAALAFGRAAEQALQANDLDAAIARAARAIQLGLTGVGLGGARLVDAEARTWRGEHKQAATSALEAMDLLAQGSEAWYRAAAVAVEASGIALRYDEQARVALRLLASTTEPGANGARVMALARAGEQMLHAGKPEVAARLYASLEAACVGEHEPSVLSRLFHARATNAKFAGDAGAYLEHSERQAEMIVKTGDLRRVAMQRISIGYAKILLGASAEAEVDLGVALQATERMGLKNLAAVARQNLGLAAARRGKVESGAAILREAIGFFVTTGDRQWEASTRVYLAEVLELGGDLEGAMREASAAAEMLEPRPPDLAHALARVAHVALRMGRPAEAMLPARRALDILEELGGIAEGEALVRLSYAEARAANGDLDAGREALASAHQRLLACAALIGDPDRRASFLHGVPEHRETLAQALDAGLA